MVTKRGASVWGVGLFLIASASLAVALLPLRPSASPGMQLAPVTARVKELSVALGTSFQEETITPDRPAFYSVTLPNSWRTTIGVSSRSGKARITLYQGGSNQPLAGTEPATGCIRWIGRPAVGTPLLIEVHTTGEATPIRLELLFEEPPLELP